MGKDSSQLSNQVGEAAHEIVKTILSNWRNDAQVTTSLSRLLIQLVDIYKHYRTSKAPFPMNPTERVQDLIEFIQDNGKLPNSFLNTPVVRYNNT